jgi:pSer/pThr/pTyr-binding forkhead associated (FHA) protein
MATTETVPYFTDPTGREHLLSGEVATIGRAVESDIVITSKRVSREHAHVQRQGRRMVLADLGSTNGTFLNNERVLASVELRDGDCVSIGDVELTFHDPESTYLETPFPEMEVDASAGIVRVDRQVVALSPKEFALLSFLYERRGQLCSKDEIGIAVWVQRRRLRLPNREPGAPAALPDRTRPCQPTDAAYGARHGIQARDPRARELTPLYPQRYQCVQENDRGSEREPA